MVETQLRALGFDVSAACDESHLCCGSAGAYSILQPQIATRLRDRKLSNLAKLEPQCILSANVGCIQHLQSGTSTPVMHWIEMLDGCSELMDAVSAQLLVRAAQGRGAVRRGGEARHGEARASSKASSRRRSMRWRNRDSAYAAIGISGLCAPDRIPC